ncbi:hypothetical protein M5K25_016343 [Dendrobium thyrsiflorum]|uniref:Uncharacterized protein n=1 Tax=Dendrobium thyrsiflorum TaxID=117978 RepID=A0ABD0URA4_DENTH
MPPLEPLSREEMSMGYERRGADFVRREEFHRQGADFVRREEFHRQALETIVEIANMRSSLLSSFSQLQKNSKCSD